VGDLGWEEETEGIGRQAVGLSEKGLKKEGKKLERLSATKSLDRGRKCANAGASIVRWEENKSGPA